jgi:hypothetical protein
LTTMPRPTCPRKARTAPGVGRCALLPGYKLSKLPEKALDAVLGVAGPAAVAVFLPDRAAARQMSWPGAVRTASIPVVSG